MASVPQMQIPRVRCSPFHTALAVDPIGSAGQYDAYLCIEVSLPWQRDISMSEPFASLCDPPAASITAADGRKWRPQGLVPAAVEDRTDVQVTVWDSPPESRSSTGVISADKARVGDASTGEASTGEGPWASAEPLQRTDWMVDPNSVESLARSILHGDSEAPARFSGSRIHSDSSALYVCTHGQRDICCGSMGTELFGQLGELDGVEVRRCSHTGGHRFAATALTFPDGYAWAHLDVGLAESITRRSIHPIEVAAHLRGSTLLPSGPAQVADRHGLCEVGWDWADARRSIELLGFERKTMATDLRVGAVMPDGSTRSFEVRVGVERHVPQITCGSIEGPEYKVEPVWRIEASRAL